MCKEVGAFPKCQCPDFVAPDSTPGVMTWPELLEHMDNLSEWGHGQLKGWSAQARWYLGEHVASKNTIIADAIMLLGAGKLPHASISLSLHIYSCTYICTYMCIFIYIYMCIKLKRTENERAM